MRLSIFGLGYVGTVCAGCLAGQNHHIVGVDVNEAKVDLLSRGRVPLFETRLDDLVGAAVARGTLTATTDARLAVADTEMSLVCVGTPSKPDGSLDTTALCSVVRQIGTAIAQKGQFHHVVIRSTVLPGTLRNLLLPILEETTGGSIGGLFGLASNPEFMREGSAVDDFHHPPKTVIGEFDAATADALEALYAGLPAPLFRTAVEVAEFAKYADNSWHALKVTFANELGAIAQLAGIDSRAVMDIFTADRKLNISAAYLKPGFAFGGSCLPKDTRAIVALAAASGLDVPVLANLIVSNERQIERGIAWILRSGCRKIAFFGLSFKAGTDDLRESPFLRMVAPLIAEGCSVRIFDRNVQLRNLVGANRDHLLKMLPQASELLVTESVQATADAELIVVTADAPEYRDALRTIGDDQIVYDFGRVAGGETLGERYHGFLW